MTALISFLAVCILFGGAVFMATYALLAPWWQSEAGRNIMTFTAGVTGLALLRVLTFFFGDGYPGQTVLRVLLFAGIAVALWWRWAMLLRAQLPRREVHADVDQEVLEGRNRAGGGDGGRDAAGWPDGHLGGR